MVLFTGLNMILLGESRKASGLSFCDFKYTIKKTVYFVQCTFLIMHDIGTNPRYERKDKRKTVKIVM